MEDIRHLLVTQAPRGFNEKLVAACISLAEQCKASNAPASEGFWRELGDIYQGVAASIEAAYNRV